MVLKNVIAHAKYIIKLEYILIGISIEKNIFQRKKSLD